MDFITVSLSKAKLQFSLFCV